MTLFFREWIWTLEEKMLSMEGLRGVGGEGQLSWGGEEQTPEGLGFLKTVSVKIDHQQDLLCLCSYASLHLGQLSLSLL